MPLSYPTGSSIIRRTCSTGHCSVRNSRATVRSSACSSLNSKSMLVAPFGRGRGSRVEGRGSQVTGRGRGWWEMFSDLRPATCDLQPSTFNLQPAGGALLGQRAVGAYLLGQAEHALADDVLLDLVGAGVDRPGARPDEGVGPAAALAVARQALVEGKLRGQPAGELAVRPEDLLDQLLDPLVELRVVELGDRRLRAGAPPLLQPREDAQRAVAQHLDLGVDAAELLADQRVLDRRLAVALEGARDLEQPGEGRLVAADAAERVAAPLVGEGRLRDLPAGVQLADKVLGRHADVVEEDLAELLAAADLLQGPDRHPRRVHVDQEAGDALVLRRRRVGARQQQAPVAVQAAARPDLMP